MNECCGNKSLGRLGRGKVQNNQNNTYKSTLTKNNDNNGVVPRGGVKSSIPPTRLHTQGQEKRRPKT